MPTPKEGGKVIQPMSEGWGDMRPGDRVYHYYVDTFSLCGKVGFYPMDSDHLTEQGPELRKQKTDCAPCFKKLEKRRGLAHRPEARGE